MASPEPTSRSRHNDSEPLDDSGGDGDFRGRRPNALSATEFGCFTDELKPKVDELESLKAAIRTQLDQTGEVIGAIAQTCRYHETTARSVAENWEEQQFQSATISKLETTIDHLIERNALQKAEADEKIRVLKEKATAGEEEEAKYKKRQLKLEAEYKTKGEEVARRAERQVKADKDKLAKDNAAELGELKTQNEKLIAEKEDLSRQVSESKRSSSQVRKRSELMIEGLERKNEELRLQLNKIRIDFAVDTKPQTYYKEEFHELQRALAKLCTRYFVELPEEAYQNCHDTSQRLRQRCPTFETTPISDSQSSYVLRLANVRHVICKIICEGIFQPFASEGVVGFPAAPAFLSVISHKIASRGSPCESAWRAMTLNAMEQSVDGPSKPAQELSGTIVEKLGPLVSALKREELKKELEKLLDRAVNLWKVCQQDGHVIKAESTPVAEDKEGWREFEKTLAIEPVELDQRQAKPATGQTSLLTFPKIMCYQYQEVEHVDAGNRAGDRSAELKALYILYPGSALFADSNYFASGASEIQRFNEETRAAAFRVAAASSPTISRRGTLRRTSMQSQQ